jgi:SAM-dependent methyltransferase
MNTLHRWYCRGGHWRRTVEERLLPWALAGAELGGDVLEIGPGPGLTTDVLATRVPRLTALEIDPTLATALRHRQAAVRVVEGDATAMPFPDASFSGAVAFTMLHHVPSAAAQDELLGEVRRVLRPGGLFAGSDSTTSFVFRLAHFRDTMQLVDPHGFAARLARAGFRDAQVRVGRGAFRFRAWR